MVWRKGICRESLLNCRRTLRKGLNLQNDPVDRLAKRGNPARKGSPLAPTFYRLSFRRAGENSLLAARVVVACRRGKVLQKVLICTPIRRGLPFARAKGSKTRSGIPRGPNAPERPLGKPKDGFPKRGLPPLSPPQRRGTMVRVGKYLLVCCFFPRQTDLPLCPPCGARKNLRAARLLDFFDRCGCSASLHLSRAALGSASHSPRPGNNQNRYFLPLAIPPYNEADRLGSAWAVGAYLDEAAGRLFYFSSRARAYGIWARAGRRRRKIPTGPPLNLPPENFCSIREQIFVLDLHSRQKSCTMKSRLR